MGKIKILDCTLRDGGYVNNWNFGEKKISRIIKNLALSGVEFIECGFLKDVKFDKNESVFNDLSYFQKKFAYFMQKTKLALMINFGEYDIKKIPRCSNQNFIIRLAFKKFNMCSALQYARELIKLGYFVFINPCVANMYSKKELIELLNEVNLIKPAAFSYVDTMGAMDKKNVLDAFCTIDEVLDKNIAFCLHLHDNLDFSFECAKALLALHSNRDIIIDSTLYGMGRGAGNIKLEEIIRYLNEKFNKSYDLKIIEKIINESIKPIFMNNPWGQSFPYRLSAICRVHPNYAKFLIQEKIKEEFMEKLFKAIPKDKRAYYDEDLIKNLALDKIK